jgi:hypothetical protein
MGIAVLSYDDWRDRINPDLLRRLWIKKDCPGHFIVRTRHGITFVEEDIGFGILRRQDSWLTPIERIELDLGWDLAHERKLKWG